MPSRVRNHLSYANVVATLALCVALGGGAAFAAGLARNSVGTRQLKSNAVTAAKIKRGAVTAKKLAHGAVIAGKLGANSIASGNLENGSVLAAKLAKNSVTNAAISNGVVGNSKLGNGAVNAVKLANGSVTIPKLGAEVAPLLGVLRSGQTLRGSFDLGGETTAARAGQTFQFPLSNPPAAPETNILEASATTPACPGVKGGNEQTPEAAAGQLCVYVKAREGEGAALGFDVGSVNRLGFGLIASFTKAEAKDQIVGFWAVTAP